jgi:mannose-6-phosphate isomerase-like protein (cupin superfamily)
MKSLTIFRPSITLLSIVLALSAYVVNATESAQTKIPLKAHKEILIDNEFTQVVRLTYPPNTESGFHKHLYPHRAIYFVQGGQLQISDANPLKTTKTLSIPDGKALFLPAAEHNIKNIGQTTIVIIETEIK